MTIASPPILVLLLLQLLRAPLAADASAADAAALAPGDETILWLGPADAGGIDGPALLDAVAVYTRDLRAAVSAAGGVPPPGAPDAGARAAAVLRARGARLGFWCEAPTADGGAVLTTVDASGKLESRPVEARRADRPELYRAVALKLRAALVSAGAASGAAAPPASAAATPAASAAAPATATAATPATRATAALATAAGAAASATTVAGHAIAPDGERWPRPFFFTLGYRLSFADGGLRHALAVEGARPLGHVVELAAGAEVATRARDSGAAGSVSVFDLPLWVAARLVRHGARLSLGGGAFAAAHLLWASATAAASGEQASSFTVAGGAGAEALARARLGRDVTAELRLFVEAALPGTRYWVRDVPILERGPRFGVGLGLAFPAP